MNFAVWLLAGLLILGLGEVNAATGSATDRVRVSGREYVRLADWARANKFTVRWLERNKTLQLSNRLAQIVFNTDPRLDLRRASVNGVRVWLAFPLSFRNGNTYIAQADLQKSLSPVLFPSANPAGLKIKTICLDAGHGGNDPGFRVSSREEKRYTLLLAQEVRSLLTQNGFKVVMTRNSDATVSREARPDIARRNKADLFVSLHFNAYPPAPEVKGVEVYCCTLSGATSFNSGGEGDTRWVDGNRNDDRNMLLAYQMQQSLVRKLPVEDRGVKRARFQVLREAAMPAILIEGGFMSNPSEGKKISDPAYRQQMARTIVDGILAYKRMVKG